MRAVKKALLRKAISHFESRIQELKKDQEELLQSLDGDGETIDLDDQSRMDEASASVERENQQISYAQKEIIILNRVFDEPKKNQVDFGAIVETDQLNFLIAANFSKLTVEDKTYLGISVEAPIYKVMIGKKEGESFSFKDRTYHIQHIY